MIHTTIFAGPMDSANMNQAQWEEVESKVWRDGVIAGARNTFTTTTTTGLGISVNTGDAIVDGFRFYADATTPLTAAAADPSLPRIDLVVLRIDEAAHTSTIALKTGTPAASPSAPTVTQTVGGTYEVGIYQVRVNAGATSITSLTDVRTYAAPVAHATAHASTGSDPISPGSIGAAALSGAAFTGDISTTGGITATGNATIDGFMLLGPAVSGSQTQFFYNTGINTLQMNTPQAGATALGIAFGTWNGSAGKIPFSIGGQFNGALAYVDNSGRFHDSAGLVTVEGTHNSVTPLKLSAGTSLPGSLDANEIFFLLA